MGLGLFQARKWLDEWGGNLEIQSSIGIGTSISLYFKKAIVPSWFVPSIKLSQNSFVVVLDDDESIHQVWRRKFFSIPGIENNVEIISFYTSEQFYLFMNGSYLCKNKNENKIFQVTGKVESYK